MDGDTVNRTVEAIGLGSEVIEDSTSLEQDKFYEFLSDLQAMLELRVEAMMDIVDVLRIVLAQSEVVETLRGLNEFRLIRVFEALMSFCKDEHMDGKEDMFNLRRMHSVSDMRMACRRCLTIPQPKFKTVYKKYEEWIEAGEFGYAYVELCDALFLTLMENSKNRGHEAYIRYKLVDCLAEAGEHAKVRAYGYFLLKWLARTFKGGNKAMEYYHALVGIIAETEGKIGEFGKGLYMTSEGIARLGSETVEIDQADASTVAKEYFRIRLSLFEKWANHLATKNSSLLSKEHLAFFKDQAKIIVGPNLGKGVVNGQFHVNDLDSALKIAKNGDIIFLEPKVYLSKNKPNDGSNPKFEIKNSVTIVGSGVRESIICSSIVNFSTGTVTLVNLGIELGSIYHVTDKEDSIKVLAGKLVLESCHVLSYVSTCFIVAYPTHMNGIGLPLPATLAMYNSFVDGGNKCTRLVDLAGLHPSFYMQGCFVENVTSLISSHLVGPTQVQIEVRSSVLDEVQCGINMQSDPGIANRVVFFANLIRLRSRENADDRFPIGMSISAGGGSFQLTKSLIESEDAEFIGVTAAGFHDMSIERTLIECKFEGQRDNSTSIGFHLCNNNRVFMRFVEVVGMHAAIAVANSRLTKELYSRIQVESSFLSNCSVGIWVQSLENPIPAIPATVTNITLRAYETQFHTAHHAILSTSPHAKTKMCRNAFVHVGTPVLVMNKHVYRHMLIDNTFIPVEHPVERLKQNGFVIDLSARSESQIAHLYLSYLGNIPHPPPLNHRFLYSILTKEQAVAFQNYYHVDYYKRKETGGRSC